MAEIKEGVEFVNQYNAKIYVTTNIIAHDENIKGLENYLIELEKRVLPESLLQIL